MLKNYLKIAFRNLLREKGYAAINVGSLAIGLACCVLISLYVRDELSYDRFHENADRIYRLVVEQEGPMHKRTTQSPKGLGTALKEMYPEIVTATGINGFACRIDINHNILPHHNSPRLQNIVEIVFMGVYEKEDIPAPLQIMH